MPSPPSANLRRHFLAWDRMGLPQVVDWLAQNWDGRGPLDLSRVLALVPTRQSGRRLREALAAHAASRGAAVFAPSVITPDALTREDLGENVASPLEALLAWVEVFLAAELEAFRDVFPVDPPGRNFAWALRLAQQFTRLQTTLAEAGLRLSDVSAALGDDFVEAARWRQIAALDELQAEHLAARGRHEPQAARIRAASRPATGMPVEKIVVLATPDPQPLALTRLAALAGAVTIDVVVFAPKSEAANFDAWGRPLAAAWEKRTIAWDAFEQRVHLCADPAEQAARLAALTSQYPAPDGSVAFGLADPEITPRLESELARAAQPAFNPEGHPFRRGGFYHLLASLAALARDPSFEAVQSLARCPDFLTSLRGGASFSIAHWLAALDALRAKHLPGNLDAAREFAARNLAAVELNRGLEAMAALRARLGTGSFTAAAGAALSELFANREFDLSNPADVQAHEAAVAWMTLLRECDAAEPHHPGLAAQDWWDLALSLFGEKNIDAGDKPAGALDLQGWLEVLWENAPHLVVAGFNDGHVPEAVVEDAFLPRSLRERLGLKTNAARFARDAYLLTAIAACRAERGRLDLLFGKTTSAGDPLRPSRLLLQCADDQLPRRIAFLFRSPAPADAKSGWTRTWKLAPRPLAPPTRVAVTALRRYLLCPFRFYVRSVLRTDSVDPLKSELDAFDFGTLCHAALEHMGRDAGLRTCTDANLLRAELLHVLDRQVAERYGKLLALPLVVQIESARQRLAKLAELQAAEHAAGWEIVQVEREFEVDVSGIIVRGKIDRIDRQAATGAIRVLDYKTSDVPVTPAFAHLRPLRPDEMAPAWAQVHVDGRWRAWSDLQLPLYLRALANEYPGRLACGYFNLPKAAGETVLSVWEDYTPELHEAAMRCAEGACAAIRRGEFWPPNENIRAERDECAALFHHGVGESIVWPAS